MPFLRSQILWKSHELPVCKPSSKRPNTPPHTHMLLQMCTYRYIQNPTNSSEGHCTDWSFPAESLGSLERTLEGLAEVSQGHRGRTLSTFLEGKAWLLVQTGVESAEGAGPRPPQERRSARWGCWRAALRGTMTSGLIVSAKTRSSFSNHSLFATDLLGLSPSTGPPRKGPRPGKSRPRKRHSFPCSLFTARRRVKFNRA